MPSDLEVILTRVFDAPRKLVVEAWTRPEHLVHWYGPRGYRLPVCEIDLRPGGAWRPVLRGPDGTEMGMKGVGRETVPSERVVSTESYDIPGMGWTPESVVTMTLDERDGKTTITSRIFYQAVEHRRSGRTTSAHRGYGPHSPRLWEFRHRLAHWW
jgi:uncharacterized protein YndB with AHSA1/START domain